MKEYREDIEFEYEDVMLAEAAEDLLEASEVLLSALLSGSIIVSPKLLAAISDMQAVIAKTKAMMHDQPTRQL